MEKVNSMFGDFELRECATLGTNWRDIWRNGSLWASQVDVDIARCFIEHPEYHGGNSFADVEILRRSAIEQEFLCMIKNGIIKTK